MSRCPRRQAGPASSACPVCGQQTHFALYTVTVHTHHLLQGPAGRWRHASTEPRRLHPTLPFLLVCESCAYPIGQPPRAVLAALKQRRRRR